MKNRIIPYIAVIALVGLILSGTTFALFSQSFNEQDNKIATGYVSVSVDEPNFDGKITDNKATKNPSVRNNGKVDCFVRAKVVFNSEFVESFDLIEAKGCWVTENGANISQTNLIPEEFIYYNGVLKSGQSTPPIFEQVTFKNLDKLKDITSSDGTTKKDLTPLDIVVYSEAVNAMGTEVTINDIVAQFKSIEAQ